MPEPTVITAIRHGETTCNAAGRQQGQLPGRLNDLGFQQAQAVAAALPPDHFAALYSSDLHRALQTAQIIAQTLNLTITPDPRLRERHLGLAQGLTLAQFQEQHPDEYARFRSHDPDYVIPQGESLRQRHQRVVVAVNDIAQRHAAQNILIITHGGTLDCLLRRALSLPINAPRCYSLYNASLNVFTISDTKWTLNTWGDINHLESLSTIDDW